MSQRSRQARKVRPARDGLAGAAVGAGGPRASHTAARQAQPRAGRKQQPQARRQAILAAALTVFAARGYEAARLDDVAAQAGVAKGTLYLYFKDKQALFEELVRGAVAPIMDRLSAAATTPDMHPTQILEMFFALFQKEVLGSNRKLVLRLIIAEGPRFPAIASFYYREVVSRGLALMRAVASKAVAQGEFSSDAAVRFPQLIVAPLLIAVIWDGLFAKIEPLDVGGLLKAHRDLLTAGGGKPAP
jgi:AcrR family transcriptional regulator